MELARLHVKSSVDNDALNATPVSSLVNTQRYCSDGKVGGGFTAVNVSSIYHDGTK